MAFQRTRAIVAGKLRTSRQVLLRGARESKSAEDHNRREWIETIETHLPLPGDRSDLQRCLSLFVRRYHPQGVVV